MRSALLALALCLGLARAGSAAALVTPDTPDQVSGVQGRELLLSQGCEACCFAGDCRAGFNGMPGICCSKQTPGCCPMGAQCIKCATRYVCSNSAHLTKRDRCQMCAERGNTPVDCMGSSDDTMGAIIFFVLLVVLCFCCFFMQNNNAATSRAYAEPVVGYPAGPGCAGPYGQPVMAQRGYGAGYGGGNVAMGAATGFLGGMVVGDMMSHHGGGGYGDGGYGGGGGGGGDAGFEADM